MPSKISIVKKYFICDEGGDCDKVFLMKRHLVFHQRVNKHEPRERRFCCDDEENDCRKSFLTKKELTRHQRDHNSEKTVHCKHCTYKSSRRDTLNEHIKRIHPGVIKGVVKKRLTRNSKKSSLSFYNSPTSFDVESIPVTLEGSSLKVHLPNWFGHNPSDDIFSEVSKMIRDRTSDGTLPDTGEGLRFCIKQFVEKISKMLTDRRSEGTLPDSREGLRFCIKLFVENLKNHTNCD
jgi:hypothetical protein